MKKRCCLCLFLIVAAILTVSCAKHVNAAADVSAVIDKATAEKQNVATLSDLAVSATELQTTAKDVFEYPAENRTANQTLPEYQYLKNRLDFSDPIYYSDLDHLLALRLKEDSAIIIGKKISSVSYARNDGKGSIDAFGGIEFNVERFFTITRFAAEKVALGGIEPGAIVTLAEEYSFLNDGSAYQAMPLYTPPIYAGETYLLIISPDDGYDKGVENAWKIDAAILVDDFSRHPENYSKEEKLEYIAKRGYFSPMEIGKEAIARFVDTE